MAGAGRDDFEARLRRLEQKAAACDAAADTTPEKSLDNMRRAPKSGRGGVFAFGLGLVAVFGIGALAAWQYKQSPFSVLPEGLTETLVSREGWLSGTAPDPSAKGPADARAATRIQSYQGWTYESPGVANSAYEPMILADVTLGVDATVLDRAPRDFVAFDPNTECTLRPPTDAEVLQNVRIERGNLETNAHAFSTPEMAKALITHIEGVTSGVSRNYKIGTMAKGRMARVDVFVTDTSGPVYLLLQDFAARTIWNLHVADGAVLAHVALIGETPAVAGLPEGTGLEALRISDFVKKIEFGSNDRIKPCMIAPWRTPQDDWRAVAEAKTDNDLFENRMYSYNAGARAFAAWYAEALPGRSPDANLVSVEQTAHVLVGPRPTTPVPYTRLSERTAQITRVDHAVIDDDALRALHDATLGAAIGGDVAMLDPAPMEVQPQ